MNEDEFRKGYTKLLTSVWEDESFIGKLSEDTNAILAGVGLPVPSGATVTIVDPTGSDVQAGLAEQFSLWSAGGEITLYVPSGKVAIELGDEALGSVAGGGDACCCCCPCCTCT
jgi:hypothetical protein